MNTNPLAVVIFLSSLSLFGVETATNAYGALQHEGKR